MFSSIDARKIGKKRSQIFAANRRKTREERKQAEREAERREREVTNEAGSLVEMKFKSDKMESENDKKDSCSSDADNGSELVTNCEFVNSETKPDESHVDTLTIIDVSIKCETDLLGNSENRIGPKLRLQAGEKSIACTQCDRKFAQRYQLDRHHRIHTVEKPIACNVHEKSFSCPQCDQKFICISNLNEHMLVHIVEKLFACEACDKKFATKKRLMKHHAFHKDDKPFACDDCNRKFVTKSGLMNHPICHTGEKLSCSDCNKKFARKASLVRHRIALHSGERPRPYACPECDKKFYKKVHMTEHYKSHTGERTYVCEKCGNSYARKNHRCFKTRKTKFTFTVPDGEGPFVCPTCGKTFARKAHLRGHFRLHTDKFACSVCGKGFRQSSHLKEHSYIHTGERPFACEICGKNFALKVLLRNHLKLHTDEFVCSECGKKFGTSTSLKEHSYIHTGERPFICDICGKDFTRKVTFKTHLLLHKNKKLFACSDCDMKFGCRSDLTAHCRIHGKKFSCDKCGKTFAEKRYLLVHTRTHTGEKPFDCSYCDKTFACKSNMDVHRRKHTGEKRNPRMPHVKIFSTDSPTIESPSIECHATNSSISDIDAIDSMHSYESEIMMDSTGIHTGQLADGLFGEKRERRDSTDSASTVDYHEMERLISEIDKSVYSRESGIAIEMGIDAGELKDVVLSTEPDQPVDAHSVEAGTNVLGDVSSDLDRCPSPVHRECSSNVACNVGSPEHSEIDTSEKLDVSAGCEMKFPDIVSMLYSQEVVHVINHCSACGMEFTRKRLMLAHQTSAHPGYKPFACEVCKKTFAQDYLLASHMQTHTRRKPYACEVCKKTFAQDYLLASHMQTHTRRKPYACEVCKKTFAHDYLLASHMQTHTRRKPHACRRCDMGFSAKTALKSHKRIHYNEPFTCDVCLKQFVNRTHLNWHLKKKCLVDPHCQTRTDEIPSVTLCVLHMQKDGPAEEITVGPPGKNSSADIDLISNPTDLATEFNEMKRSKSGIDGNISSVDECKKEYPVCGIDITVSVHNDMLSDLSVGTRRREPHVDRNPISNNHGTDLSVDATSQVSHIHQPHSNAGCSSTPFETVLFIKILKYPRREKIHECLHCDKKFTNRARVIDHQRIHTGEKPFSCSVCEKSFSKLSYLKNHEIIHSNVNPFSCSNCGMEFRNRGTYYYHRQRKCAGGKPSVMGKILF